MVNIPKYVNKFIGDVDNGIVQIADSPNTLMTIAVAFCIVIAGITFIIVLIKLDMLVDLVQCICCSKKGKQTKLEARRHLRKPQRNPNESSKEDEEV